MFTKTELKALVMSGFALAIILAGCSQGSGTNPMLNPVAPPTNGQQTNSSANPSITGINPSEAKINDEITITGSGFGFDSSAGSVAVGGVAALSIISWTDTEIRVAVPASALTGTVTATVNGKAAEGPPLIVLWDKQNPENVLVPGNHYGGLNMAVIPDEANGAIIVWNDYRNYNPPPPPDPNNPGPPPPAPPAQINIYAQRINSRGIAKWTTAGTAVSVVAGGQFFPQLVSDGAGGAIVVWEDYRQDGVTADIYAQRISNNGDILWASDTPVAAASNGQEKPHIASDGFGGAIIVWQDYRSGSRYDVYAQRINADGVPQWTADGVAVSTATNNPQFLFPQIVPDGSGGAVMVWQDKRSGSFSLYAQRINASGGVQWTVNGVAISTIGASYHNVASPVPDGAGGAIIGWESSSGVNGVDVYAQKIDGNGVVQWGAAGIIVSGAANDQLNVQLTTDSAGGAILTWEDWRSGSAVRDIYAQRINAAGNALWTADGVPVCTADYSQFEPQIVSDGRGGAIITWYDYRNYNTTNNGVLEGVDVYAQRINAAGNALWTGNGKAVSTADLNQQYPKIVADRSGGAIIAWEDERSGTTADIYAQGISPKGNQ